MGNSPSKNDPPPNNQSNSATTGIVDGELETDESAPALSHLPTPKSQPSRSSKASAINIGTSPSSNTFNSNYNKNKNDKIPRTSKIKINTESPKATRKYSNHDLELDLEIGASMAQLLKSSNSQAVYCSSVDSIKSDASTMSPVFTTVGETKDEDLVLSLGSTSPFGKNYYYKDETKECFANAHNSGACNTSSNGNCNGLAKRLDAISELDSTAESIRTRHSTSSNSDSSLTSANLKKHELKIPPVLGEALAKNVSSSSSNLSNSPPLIPVNNKVGIDLDGVIDRLIEIGLSKKSSSRRASKDKLPVTASEIKYILHKSRSIFLEQPTLLRLSPPVKVVGDIHGQFHDLIRIFNSCGYPPYSNYLFLGDYVDRGHKSLETILLLLCYKIKYPENFFMLRGNHESANITKIYGFYDECKRRLPAISGNHKLWKTFIDVFNTLPIAATINDKIFCIHGGLSPDLYDLKQIDNIKRPTDIPEKGLLADLLWSDPDPLVKTFSVNNWPKNDRGVSYRFGKKHVDYFCNKFKMDLIVRGHMVVEDGYEFFNKRKLVTIFSAPNYCGEFNNFGAVMSVDKSLYCSFELIKPQ